MKFLTKNLAFIVATLLFFNVEESKAEFSNLVPCAQSSNFQKRLNSSLKKIENRQKLYNNENKALAKESEAIKARFERYSNSNLLCGKEGLPRIIATGQWDHANEFVLPAILFLYITGWIGWVGRKYLHYASTTDNAFENEIIINIPVAISIMNSGFLWPVDAWKEFATGDLLISKEEENTSPR